MRSELAAGRNVFDLSACSGSRDPDGRGEYPCDTFYSAAAKGSYREDSSSGMAYYEPIEVTDSEGSSNVCTQPSSGVTGECDDGINGATAVMES